MDFTCKMKRSLFGFFKHESKEEDPIELQVTKDTEKERRKRIKQLEEEEEERLEHLKNPDMPFTFDDILDYRFDGDTIQRALEELNVEILKRQIRKKYPHKFKDL